MGNSEVGHLNIGAGRVVLQELALINRAVETGELADNPVLQDLFGYCVRENKPLHCCGLVSDGGVHSHARHLVSLCGLAHAAGVRRLFIHAFTDGRDTDPKSGLQSLARLQESVESTGAVIASVVGRYYAMDRDRRWERIRRAYDLLVHGKGRLAEDVLAAVKDSYRDGITDEFILPIARSVDGRPAAVISDGDAVLCFNFRTDRCRQITRALTQQDFPEHGMRKLKLKYVTLTRYDDTFRDVGVVFDHTHLHGTLGEALARAGKRQLRISETEKYPHVTFFFNGGREEAFPGEDRVLIPSPKVATYDLKPSMSAVEVKDALLAELAKETYDFVCVNFANPDMVGHTGVLEAAVAAVETVDACARDIVETGLRHGYRFLVTADHGNAEAMRNPDGSPNTAHTTNPVPCFYIGADAGDKSLRPGLLADLAPTVLDLMGVPPPAEMTGKSLLKS
jgi:2,3-bisphosphoglycerate-independent phosphoglycerate mutase